MSTSRSDSSYNLAGAATVARRLTATTPEARPPAPAYIRFSSARFPNSAVPALQVVEEEPVLGWIPEMEGPPGWAVLLQRAMELTAAEGALVVDPQGLVIASLGTLPGEGADAIGARLTIAFAQADHMGNMGGKARSLTIQLDNRWLTGLRIVVGEEERLIVGFSAASALGTGTLNALAKVFVRKAMGA